MRADEAVGRPGVAGGGGRRGGGAGIRGSGLPRGPGSGTQGRRGRGRGVHERAGGIGTPRACRHGVVIVLHLDVDRTGQPPGSSGRAEAGKVRGERGGQNSVRWVRNKEGQGGGRHRRLPWQTREGGRWGGGAAEWRPGRSRRPCRCPERRKRLPGDALGSSGPGTHRPGPAPPGARTSASAPRSPAGCRRRGTSPGCGRRRRGGTTRLPPNPAGSLAHAGGRARTTPRPPRAPRQR